ncbi:hypothetical protein D3C71_1295240 [compost metagenome]
MGCCGKLRDSLLNHWCRDVWYDGRRWAIPCIQRQGIDWGRLVRQRMLPIAPVARVVHLFAGVAAAHDGLREYALGGDGDFE